MTDPKSQLVGLTDRLATSVLKRYWFQFELIDAPSALNLGCGITAYSRDDALTILRERVFRGGDSPRIVNVQEDVDVSTLDPKHVLGNIGLVVDRGVWFPLGC